MSYKQLYQQLFKTNILNYFKLLLFFVGQYRGNIICGHYIRTEIGKQDHPIDL
jgi:hypothetical protein